MVKDDLSPSEKASGLLGPAESPEGHLEYVDCPRENCGETIRLAELDSHISMHDIENNNEEENFHQDPNTNKRSRASAYESEPKFDTRLPPALRNLAAPKSSISSSSSRQAIAKAGLRKLFNMSGSKAKSQKSPGSKRPHRRLGVSFLASLDKPVANSSMEV